jgi:hypothetical protein
MYIKLINNNTTMPYTIAQLKNDNPQVSFPSEIPADTLASFGVYALLPTLTPEYNVDTQRVNEGEPILINDAWTQTWVITNKSAEELNTELFNWRKRVKVSPLQMRRALRQQELVSAVTAYIAQQSEDTQDAWEYAIEIRRNDPLIESAAAALGKTPAEIDDLFRLAQTL